MSFLSLLLYLLLANGFFIFFTKRSFGECIPLTMMVNAFTYFLSQLIFHTFTVGFYLNLSYAIFFLIVLITKRKNKDVIKLWKNNFFSKGFYIFLLIYIIVFIYDYNRSFHVWDEWSHWGEMIKEMLRLDQFYSVESSTLLVHKDYPPIIQLLELFFCNIRCVWGGGTMKLI